MGEKRKRSEDSYSEAELGVKGVSETPEKRQRVEIAEPCTPKLLTRENLALLDGEMAPKKKEAEKDDSSNTGSTQAQRDSVRNLGLKLDYQGLLFGDRETRTAPLVQKVKDWATGNRLSQMDEGEAEGFEEARFEYKARSEDDFVLTVWCLLLLPTRTVKKAGDGDTLTNDERVLRLWRDDGLDLTANQLYLLQSVPELDTSGDPVLQALLSDMPRVKTPKPDRSYGLRAAAFTKEEQHLNNKLERITKVARSIYYTFFVVEFKSCGAPITEAQLQARRTGASLVYSMREFKRRAGILNETCSQDDGSYVFSVAMTPDVAQLYMHWAVEESDHKVTYHMHELNAYCLTKPRDVKEFRRDVDNVMEWGLTTRKIYIKECLVKIRTLDPDVKLAETSSKAPSKATTSKATTSKATTSKAASSKTASKTASSKAAVLVPAVDWDSEREDTEDELLV